MKNKKMFRLLLCLMVVVSSCKSQTTFSLRCEIPAGISFKDSSQVFFNKKPLGRLLVKKLESNKITATINFGQSITVPQNSVLVFHENHLGVSCFEIIEGNSKAALKKNELITYSNDSSKLVNDSLPRRNKIDLNKFTNPKVIIDSTNK